MVAVAGLGSNKPALSTEAYKKLVSPLCTPAFETKVTVAVPPVAGILALTSKAKPSKYSVPFSGKVLITK